MLTTEQVSSIERLLRAGLTGRQVARKLGHSRGTVRAVKHGRHCLVLARQNELEEPGGSESYHYRVDPLQRCGKCGARLVEAPCRVCRLRLSRRRLFHAVESAEPLESRLEAPEVSRILDTITMASGKIPRDRPRARVLRSPGFRFHLGTFGPVFYARLHPPITIPAESPKEHAG